MNRHDYLTVLRTTQPCNKHATRTRDGGVKKTPGKPITAAKATVRAVPDQDAMLALLRELSKDPNAVLLQGFHPEMIPAPGETVGPEFGVVSAKNMAKTLGVPEGDPAVTKEIHTIKGQKVTVRAKALMVPSTWGLFDRDITDGMPDHLAKLDEPGWLEAMASMVTGLDAAGLIAVDSTSGRIWDEEAALEASGAHYWAQATDPYDWERFGATLLARSFLHRYGFRRTWGDGGTRNWSIFDPTTFSHERIVYAGMPTVSGPGLEVRGASIRLVRKGGRLDTAQLADLITEEAEQVMRVTGTEIVSEPTRRRVLRTDGTIATVTARQPVTVDRGALKLETEIEIQGAKLTLEDYWVGDQGKLRCQTPFRSSTSWNGILNRHKDGVPFLFDNGTRIRYELPLDVITAERVEIIKRHLKTIGRDRATKRWATLAVPLGKLEQDEIRLWMSDTFEIGRRVLSAQLKEAVTDAVNERTEAAIARERQELEGRGVTVIEYVETELPIVLPMIEAAALNDTVYSRDGRLVQITDQRPATVRQVQRLHKLGDEYPPVRLIAPYNQETLRLHLLRNVAMFTPGFPPVRIVPPPMLLNTMLVDSPLRARPLTALITTPCVTGKGKVLVEQGYHPETGFYLDFPTGLVPEIPKRITKRMAGESVEWLRSKLFAEWPFETDLDLDAAVVLALTAVQRRLCSIAPGFATTAPQQSTGKTALLELISMIAFDRPLPAAAFTNNEDEMAKQLQGFGLEGLPMILFDNLTEGSAIEGDNLAKFMTSQMFSSRQHWKHGQTAVPTQMLVCFSGNNVYPSGDFNTRVINIKLDAKEEHPERRKFERGDLAEWAETHRGEFFKHALTILTGGIRAGANSVETRFNDWGRLVLAPAMWAGCGDVSELFARNNEHDHKRNERLDLMNALWEKFGSGWFHATDIANLAKNDRFSFVLTDDEQAIVDALRAALHTGKPESPKSVGTMLANTQGKVMGGLRLDKEQRDYTTKKPVAWRITPVDGRDPF
jgi:hypothetical protein